MSIVAKISQGKIVEKRIVEGKVYDAVKREGAALLNKWNPTSSDFIILRDYVTLSYKAPITKELLEKIREFSPKRIGDKIEVTVPVFEVVYNSTWTGDNMKIDDAVVVAPHIDDESDQRILDSVAREFAEAEEME
ncbi:DUF2286 domain-containing protein [Thermoproteus tenax]|uniref:DUF2286 domain-containing protein n=1 Tax=Thermoproteus tenax (strain ATCC 35583 / DSM 2078 / JCM 9277 / NBRC 100435 / Kra 1) TaxID=768679 RepID=G4RML3_THETK|nr:DUF2286 domain-containing protein [Thermoproteus tenax]CCC80844.1 conserved hypothetical protein [Thermoproteus tenax Kra 1]